MQSPKSYIHYFTHHLHFPQPVDFLATSSLHLQGLLGFCGLHWEHRQLYIKRNGIHMSHRVIPINPMQNSNKYPKKIQRNFATCTKASDTYQLLASLLMQTGFSALQNKYHILKIYCSCKQLTPNDT